MSDKNRWILAGAWALLVAGGLGGAALIQRHLEPRPVADLPKEPLERPKPKKDPGEEARRRLAASLEVITPKILPKTDAAATLWTTIHVPPPPPPAPPVLVIMPTALYSGTVDLDRTRLSWKLSALSMNTKGERSQPEAILIHRQADGGEIERIAVLDPKVTSFEDFEVQPGRSYRYWVVLRGAEGLKDGNQAAPLIEKEGEGLVEGRTPEWIKIRLVGGDASRAILNVETYNPLKGRWETTVAQAALGQPIGRTGWTLERTRFDRFTLIAELKDDRSEIRLFSTRKD